MNLLMVTNTYLPHVGGVANSVDRFTREYRRRGHRVVVLAPEYPGDPGDETDVIRFPAIPDVFDSSFSLSLPVPGYLDLALGDFAPDLVHSHHPFLLGDAALRLAGRRDLPLVFTHHTRFEHYTHYAPGDSEALGVFVRDLTRGYANLSDLVFAPSASVARDLAAGGVRRPIEVVPTGVDLSVFGAGDRARFRREMGLPATVPVIAHVGRLAPEKNLGFLARAVAACLARRRDARFVLVGEGSSLPEVERILGEAGVADRYHHLGVLRGGELADAYAAADVFAFSSFSETQGMVLTEAMAAGTPVVALDAHGVREVVRDGENGRLLPAASAPEAMTQALLAMLAAPEEARQGLREAARATAREFSVEATADRALACYGSLVEAHRFLRDPEEEGLWDVLLRGAEAEFELWGNMAAATASALSGVLGISGTDAERGSPGDAGTVPDRRD